MKERKYLFHSNYLTLNRNQIKNLKNIFIKIRKSKNYIIKEDFISIFDLFYVFPLYKNYFFN